MRYLPSKTFPCRDFSANFNPPKIMQSALLVSGQWSSPKTQLSLSHVYPFPPGGKGGAVEAGEVVVVGAGGGMTLGNFSSSISQ